MVQIVAANGEVEATSTHSVSFSKPGVVACQLSAQAFSGEPHTGRAEAWIFESLMDMVQSEAALADLVWIPAKNGVAANILFALDVSPGVWTSLQHFHKLLCNRKMELVST